MAKGNIRLARRLDEYSHHPVTIALNKASALASILEQLGETTTPISNNLVNALRDGSHAPEALDWLRGVVGDALRAAIAEAETAFRQSLTPEQVHEQVTGGPKAVA